MVFRISRQTRLRKRRSTVIRVRVRVRVRLRNRRSTVIRVRARVRDAGRVRARVRRSFKFMGGEAD